MDWQIGNVWSCPAAGLRWVPLVSTGRATRNPLGNSYYFCTWTRQKADRTRIWPALVWSKLGFGPTWSDPSRSEPTWSDFGTRLGPFSLRFSIVGALQVQMQVEMQVRMQVEMQVQVQVQVHMEMQVDMQMQVHMQVHMRVQMEVRTQLQMQVEMQVQLSTSLRIFRDGTAMWLGRPVECQ